MSTKKATKTIHVCDFCEREQDYIEACLKCGKEICYECRKKHAVEYAHAVYFSGSGDGLYCQSCDAQLQISGRDKRRTAYLRIQSLRREANAWGEDFKRRSNEAEAEVKRHQP